MPKQRYRIMRSYLSTRGTLALDMMYATATVQANFDFESEADMVAKLRMALGVTPIVSAIFANSGKLASYAPTSLICSVSEWMRFVIRSTYRHSGRM